ncbi:glycoside hydrolase family 128 protein [Hyaloscypha variabilis]
MAVSYKLVLIGAVVSSLFAGISTAQPYPKRGLGANEDVPIWQFGGTWEGAPSQVNWQYNWASTTDQKNSWCEYIPMLWGDDSAHTDTWFSDASYWLADGGSGHLLAFNEPEQASQSNLSPQDAASAYLTWMTPFSGRAQLGSPAVSNDGWSWITEFMSLCGDCGVTFIAVHWYNDYTLFSDFQNWVNDACSFGLPVWITEFEGYGTVDEQSSFLSEAIPWLDNNACVYRYSYFGTADNDEILLENGGPALSPIGVQYTFSAY